ncbi:MAG TPA: carboxylate-amine ligase [Hyphomicrobiaceae bacterium]|nr:carboxylate-amine ligase [Hyphomicrobiaceae bacterium]
MPLPEPRLTFGIEEEYHIVDSRTRQLASLPPALLEACQAALPGQIGTELLQSQLEVGTRPAKTMAGARADLSHLRSTVARLSASHGLAPVAASTHPFGGYRLQKTTQAERYLGLASDLAGIGRRLVICGMHVHVDLGDNELRIDIMNQARYFLPHLLALSTSSPFWEGEDTGLKSFRLAIFNELPRTGLPERMESWAKYQQTVDVLVSAGVMEDASKVWWDLRPSAKFPTLELRITDVCTRMEDALTIAALYLCICRALYRLRRNNQSWRQYPLLLLAENRWRAQRYGVQGSLFDLGTGALVPLPQLLDEIIDLTAEDAAALGCEDEIRRARTIAGGGTSADRQSAILQAAIDRGRTQHEALSEVVDWLIAETANLGPT